MSAPERIWAEHRTCTVDASGAARLLAMDREFRRGTEYIRRDTTHTDADMERAVRAALEAAVGVAKSWKDCGHDFDVEAEIRALDPAEIVRAAREGGE